MYFINIKFDQQVNEREVIKTHVMKESSSQSGTSGVSNSRYSANNLSSPESAYSTGYSTDGTSPGAPPENLLNTSKATGEKVDFWNISRSCWEEILT